MKKESISVKSFHRSVNIAYFSLVHPSGNKNEEQSQYYRYACKEVPVVLAEKAAVPLLPRNKAANGEKKDEDKEKS